MKIGLEIQPILKDKTGVGWHTQKIIEQFKNGKFQFEGYGFNFLHRNKVSADLSRLNFKCKINPFIPYGVYKRIWRFLPFTYNFLFNSNADIYHFFNFIVPPRIKGKVIVTVHDMVYKAYPETMSDKNFKLLDRELKRSLDRADKIVTVSEFSKMEISNLINIPSSKIDVVYNGVDEIYYNNDFDENQQEKIRTKYGLPPKYMLYLGTIEPRKNIGRIIEAYYNYVRETRDDVYLVIAGKIGWKCDEVFQKIRDYRLEKRIILTGYVEEDDKPLIYKMSSLFIFPSLYEGFGMPVLEAMAAGVPVITSKTSALPEVAGDAAMPVDPLDVGQIAEYIKIVFRDDALRNDMIKRGIRQSMKFSWEKSAEKLLSIYEEVSKL